MGWALYSSRFNIQKTSSALASGESTRASCQFCLDSSTEYRLLVMNRVTGPKARDMEIIFPSILARYLVPMVNDPSAFQSMFRKDTIFDSGICICPLARLTTKPSQIRHWVGFHTDLEGWTKNPAQSRVERTSALLVPADSMSDATPRPSSR